VSPIAWFLLVLALGGWTLAIVGFCGFAKREKVLLGLLKKSIIDWGRDVFDLGIAWRTYVHDTANPDWKADVPCRRRLIEQYDEHKRYF